MIIEQSLQIQAPVDEVWDFINDIPAVSACVPGVEAFDVIENDIYEGTLKVKVGPITVRLSGRVTVQERDREALHSVMQVEAADRRLNSAVSARTTIQLASSGPSSTDVTILTDASVLGKLGEFGQAVIRRKADQVIGDFSKNMTQTIASRP